MAESETQTFCAAPGVLISVPQLRDPNFARSVVLMLVHSGDGALGLVINHETSLLCADVVKLFGMTWPGDPGEHVLRTGPVEPEGLWIVHDGSVETEEVLVAAAGVVTSRSRDALDALCAAQASPLVLGVGCAGWGPGQLEGEMAAGAWINAPVTPEMAFEWPRDEVWERALGTLGIDPALLMAGGGMQ